MIKGNGSYIRTGVLISRYIQWCAIPFVSYCFQPDKIVYYLWNRKSDFDGFSAISDSFTKIVQGSNFSVWFGGSFCDF